jgi:Rha family phage regulatory protein
MKAQKELKLVEVHGKKLLTNSLVIAEQFKKRHDNILQKIDVGFNSKIPEILEFTRLNFKESSYLGKDGAETKYYLMTEEGFAEIAMSLTGEKSKLVRIRFLNEFKRLIKLINDPTRKEAIRYKRDTWEPLTDMLKFTREGLGKETEKKHYSNEAKFCNRALNGKYEPLDESALDVYDARLLAAIRTHNAMLLTRFLPQGERKQLMDNFVVEYRIKHPRFTLIS